MPSVLANSITNWNVSILCCCCRQVASVMFDSVRPHRWQPTRLPRPWDSPGKNTGVGCHFLLQCMNEKWKWSHSVVSDSLQHHGLQPTRLLRPWDFPGKSTGVGCHCLLHRRDICADNYWYKYRSMSWWVGKCRDMAHSVYPR